MYNIFLPNINLIQRLPLNVLIVGEHEQQQRVVRPNGFPAYHIMYSQKGTGMLEIENKRYVVPENSLFILKPNQPHIYYPTTREWNTRWVVFEGKEAESYLNNLCLNDMEPTAVNNDQHYGNYFDMICKNSKVQGIESLFKTYSILNSMLIDISYMIYYNNEKNTGEGSQKLNRVLSYVHENYNRNISLDDIAESINVSKQYLCRLFKNHMAVSPYEYLIEYRLKAAKEFLSNSSLSVKEISVLAGFNTISYFCHVFKKHENMTPNEFRDLCLMV